MLTTWCFSVVLKLDIIAQADDERQKQIYSIQILCLSRFPETTIQRTISIPDKNPEPN